LQEKEKRQGPHTTLTKQRAYKLAIDKTYFGSLKELAPEAMGTIIKEAIGFRDGLLVRCYNEIKSTRESGDCGNGKPCELEVELERFLGKVN